MDDMQEIMEDFLIEAFEMVDQLEPRLSRARKQPRRSRSY